MKEPQPPLFDHLSALADTTRSRLLLVLERHELTVGELCAVLQLPQSTASRHLKVLADEGWVTSRQEGTSRAYRMLPERLDDASRGLWALVREAASALPAAAQDARRVRGVLARRRTRSQDFFRTAAGRWDRMRAELFGARADLHGLLGLLDPAWTVGDLGCGTGQASEALAPFVGRVVAVDNSEAMLEEARRRLAPLANVELREGALEALPLDDASLDAAVLVLALDYLDDPVPALAEARRVLRPGGRLLVMDMTPHDREEYRQAMGHAHLGIAAADLEAWGREAGLEGFRHVALPPDPDAKGPALFAATLRRPAPVGRGGDDASPDRMEDDVTQTGTDFDTDTVGTRDVPGTTPTPVSPARSRT